MATDKSRSKKRGKVRRPGAKNRSSFEFGALYRLAQVLTAALLLYVTASLFAIGTGTLGEGVSDHVLRAAGGGVILILLHLFYGLICSLLGRQVSSVYSQWLGTFSLYGALSLFLGLIKRSALLGDIGLLSPGVFGLLCAAVLPRFVGVVGTILVGLCMVFLSAFNYGHLNAERVERFREMLSGIRLPHVSLPARKNSGPAVPADEQEPEAPEGEPDAEPSLDTADEDATENVEDEATAPEEPVAEDAEDLSETDDAEAETPVSEDAGEEEPAENREEAAPRIGLADRIKGAVSSFLYMLGYTEGKHGGKDTDGVEDGAAVLVQEQHTDTDTAVHTEDGEVDFHVSESEKDVEKRGEESSPLLPPPDPQELKRDENVELIESSRRSPIGVQNVRGIKTGVGNTETAELPVQTAPVTSEPEVEIETAAELDGTESANARQGIPAGSFPPPLDLLGEHREIKEVIDDGQAIDNGNAVISSLADFGVSAELKRTIIGPTVVQYQIQLAPGIKVSKVSSLGNDIAVALGVPSIRVEAPIPGTSYIGIELPNVNRRAVPLRQVLESKVFQDTKLRLPLPLGQTVDGRILIAGLEELPHLLIAGTTGSGKSIFVNNCIVAMCWHNTPQDLRFIMVDPKRVEMGIYEFLPHILAKPIMTANSAVHALGWAVREMERRYDVCSQAKVRNISSYNEKVLPKDRLPHIVIVVDELADLMMTAQKEVEDYIMRLAQMARAVGIHLMLATQRPSVNVLTGTIKANVPARVSFSLPTVVDSRTIIDRPGAQNLLGKGDMLFVSTKNPHPLRIQSPFIDEQTNIRIVEYLRSTFGDPEYIDLEEQGDGGGASASSGFVEDDRLEEAIGIVLSTGIASTSGLQRRMKVGFTRAGNMIDTMEQMGIIGPKNGAKPREILVDESEAYVILEQHRNK